MGKHRGTVYPKRVKGKGGFSRVVGSRSPRKMGRKRRGSKHGTSHGTSHIK